MFERIYQKISSVFPRGFIRHVSKIMVQGGFEELQPRLFIGFAIFFSMSMAGIAFFFTPFFTANELIQAVAAPIVLGIFLVCFYLYLVMTADSRAHKIEEILPDMLQIISANMKAGMTMENAIWSAARPEFGPLCDEIKRVSADTFGGTPIEKTLTAMTTRVRSVILERAVRLIVEGIHLGGEMSQLLEEVSEDIRSNYQLREQIATSTLMYAMFIIFASTFAAPILFSVSVFYSEMNEQVLAKQSDAMGDIDMQGMAMEQGMSSLPGMGMGASTEKGITSQDFWWFAVGALAVTNFLGAFILSTIRTGKALNGIRYAPILAIIAIVIFIAVNEGIRTVFGGMLI